MIGKHCPIFAVNREVSLFLNNSIYASISYSILAGVGVGRCFELCYIWVYDVHGLIPTAKPKDCADPYKM